MVHVCAACGVMRPAEDLIVFWAIADPGRLRHVCRPTRSTASRESCFTVAVGPASRFGIALAAPPPLVPWVSPGPVRPGTAEWGQLMASAGVKAA